MQKYFRSAETGKTQKNLSKNYIRELPMLIPDDVKEQEVIVNKIAPIEAAIKKFKTQIKPDTEIINEVFTAKFSWDTKIFDELKNVHIMNCTFSAFTNNIDNRFSFKFHNKAGAYVSQILKSQTSKRIKDYLAEPIVLGASISPSEFDENGECYYISMASVKNWQLELDETQLVSGNYETENSNKKILPGDIIMTRSGVAIGKFALIEEEVNGIFADFTMRIRLKDYNSLFAYYYFRTFFFQYLIYTHKKGLQNQNIFPSQMRELPIPEISLSEQEKIVTAIKTETDKQREFDKKIQDKKEEITRIIQEAIN